ncbi:hypothetical protein K443DRAFT_681331 [Laccaria amethystina LaAM-08-1]|uniref:Zn(2)-C6 fungal-type domain-containing protein n=1 Tax=Laccaria amethystina LaAM-08-1 TaxID=1095629 RepID=A0A0C9XNV9_9AGAR|nr:hypothetical protein K443DRAFT_681331 [Laccaria amethystina LaAM-08-1]
MATYADNAPAQNTSPTIEPPADDAGKKKKTMKRRKVNHACLYCRRSHMTCDEGRPCQRCLKREIGHLCHDERRPKVPDIQTHHPTTTGVSVDVPRTYAPVTAYQAPPPQPTLSWPSTFPYQPENFGNEFSVLTDFLETLDDGFYFNPPTTIIPTLVSPPAFTTQTTLVPPSQPPPPLQPSSHPSVLTTVTPPSKPLEDTTPTILLAATKTEKFLLTAADQEPGSRNERLNRVIRAKYEAGLLKPYNYVNGYARLSRWMDRNVSQESKQQILQPLSVLRPKFRAIAQSLQDIDLVFIEEEFERMLLDYDRVFSAMGVPACLWRRTGEIYKGNREFTELVGVDGHMMRDGRLCIYELMAEESAVNYWEKYGHVAFDSSQKAVLTSCVLRYKPVIKVGSSSPNAPPKKPLKNDEAAQREPQGEEGFISCCFSFTIRRDRHGIPSMIVGNFIKC